MSRVKDQAAEAASLDAAPPHFDREAAASIDAMFDTRAIRVTAKQAMRRRAGFAFTAEPVVIGVAMVDADQVAALAADPLLVVEVTVDGEAWAVLPADISDFSPPDRTDD